MDKDLAALQGINPLLAKITDGEDLTAEEAQGIFSTIFVRDKEGYYFTALVAAIHAKGETADELLGFIRATKSLSEPLLLEIPVEKTTDLSGSGGGVFKTINVSTAAAFVVAAAGYYVPKESYFAVTSPTGSADVFAAFGIDIMQLTRGQIKDSLEQIGIVPLFHPLLSPKLANRARISRKVFGEYGIKIRTPFHLVSNLCSPITTQYRVYGVYSERYLSIIADLLRKLEYKHSLVFWGEPGMPEVSNVGKTIVVEQTGKKLKRYELTPKDLGVRQVKPEEIETGGKEQNIIDFLRVLAGKEKGAKRDLVAVNAAAALYVLGHKPSIRESVPVTQELIDQGAGLRKLEQLVAKVGNPTLLDDWKKKAHL